MSASKLEEVFGQAAKNFGNLELSESRIDYRQQKWVSNFSIAQINTRIHRIRKPVDREDIINRLKVSVNRVSSNPYLKRKVFIVINFLSKAELETSVNNLKAGNEFENKGVTLQIE